jgi:tRNA A37 methylthiotransferase MiaB
MAKQHNGGSAAGKIFKQKAKQDGKKNSAGAKKAKPSKKRRESNPQNLWAYAGYTTGCPSNCGHCVTCLIARGNREQSKIIERFRGF